MSRTLWGWIRLGFSTRQAQALDQLETKVEQLQSQGIEQTFVDGGSPSDLPNPPAE